MRIVLASFVADDPDTGMGRWQHRIAAALRAMGHDATIWFAEDFPAVGRTGRFAFLTYPPAVALRLVRRRGDFDAVVLHEPAGLWYGLARRVRPALPPLVAMCHNVEAKVHEVMRAAERRGLAARRPWTAISTRLLRLPQSRAAIRLADHVVCLSSEDERYIAEALRVAPARITRLTNGLAAGEAGGGREPPCGRRVLFVGGWLDVKGRRLLPPLWRAVRCALPDASLTLVGVHDAGAAVASEFAPEDRADLVCIPVVRDGAEMRRLFAEHDALIVPSLSEGSPLTVLEAMGAGLPVVAAAVGGIPDSAADGSEALLFRPMDAADGAAKLIRLLGDPALAGRLSAAAVARVRGFTWEAAARALVRAIERTRA